MNVAFFQPPAAQRIGGLDAAIQGLRSALTRQGLTINDALSDDTAPQIAHFHGLWQPDHARSSALCRKRQIPYIVSPHGMLEPWAWRHKWWKKWPYFYCVEKRHLAGAHALLATAQPEAKRLARFARGPRIESLPLGLTGEARPDYVASRQKLGWAAEEVVLLYLSRLHVKKGLDLLLRALTKMRWPAVTRLVIVGDGEPDYVYQLKAFAEKQVSLLPRIDWVGAAWGEARWKYFQGADLFCLPTHSENFGLAVLEACQVGTPALTTVDTPWAEDLGGGRGYIATPQVDSLKARLGDFFSAPRQSTEQRKGLADWAWGKFHWDALAPDYATLYRSLFTERARQR